MQIFYFFTELCLQGWQNFPSFLLTVYAIVSQPFFVEATPHLSFLQSSWDPAQFMLFPFS